VPLDTSKRWLYDSPFAVIHNTDGPVTAMTSATRRWACYAINSFFSVGHWLSLAAEPSSVTAVTPSTQPPSINNASTLFLGGNKVVQTRKQQE
jgi:hypothetical protein